MQKEQPMAVAVTQPAATSTRQKRRRPVSGFEKFVAWFWVGPAVVFVGVLLLYPLLNTIYISFFNFDSSQYVGLKNFSTIFTNHYYQGVLRNNILWLVLATAGTVLLGLIIAVLVDRVRFESFAKATIFIPMAISMVATGVIWRFVYAYAAPGDPQFGLLNAIVTKLGGQPQAWIQNFNGSSNYMLIIAYVWMWTGFSMVILSAALKSIPTEILEAARVDGASPLAIFFRITVPMISPTIIVVTTTMLINVLKIFDIVYVMTGGNYNTDVIGMEYYTQEYTNSDFGLASAFAVILLIAVIPVMLFNIRRFRAQEGHR
jgi:alpha-glucoside transport system permease protein